MPGLKALDLSVFVRPGVDSESDLHVVPGFGREHDSSAGCWCRPSVEFEEGDGRMYVHHPEC